MPNTELPIDLEQQVLMMKRYVNFRQRKKIREFLSYAGYFRASRYGKYLLSKVGVLGSKSNTSLYFDTYNFDLQLRQLLFKYCMKAEIYFKSNLSNAISIKTGDAAFYLDKQYYTPTKSEKDKNTRNKNIRFFNTRFFPGLVDQEEALRKDVVKHPELKEYRKGGSRQNNVLPVWAAFTYFELGTIVMMYSYLRGDLRKEVLKGNTEATLEHLEQTAKYSIIYDTLPDRFTLDSTLLSGNEGLYSCLHVMQHTCL